MKLKALIAAVLLISGAAHADYGDMHLYSLVSPYGAKTLRVIEVDSVTLNIQQCDENGVGCGQPYDFKRESSHGKTWSHKYAGGTIPPETITKTAKGSIIFKSHPFTYAKGDDEAEQASSLTAIFVPR